MKNDTVRQAYTKILTLCDQKLMDIRTGQKVISNLSTLSSGI